MKGGWKHWPRDLDIFLAVEAHKPWKDIPAYSLTVRIKGLIL
jgi:hypothetical protein